MSENNNKENITVTPSIDAFAVVVAANVPPRFIAQMKAGKLKPAALVFEQVGAGGLTAGDPVSAPVRDLLPEEVVMVMQRAMQDGKISVAVTFDVPERKATVVRV